MPPRHRGFTLIEVVVALAVAGFLFAIAAPIYAGATEAAHAASARAALLASLTRSINRAALTGIEVVLCPGDTGGCRDSADWSGGWVAWTDLDGDRVRNPGEPLVHREPRLDGKVHLRSTSGRRRLVFQPSGGNAGSNVTFTLCDGRGATKAVSLVLANDGRLRSSDAAPAAAQACVLAAP